MKRTYIIQWGQPRRAGGAAAAACVYSFKETESWREKRATRVREITTWIKERVWRAANVMEQWLQSNLLSLSYISTANKKDKARWQTDATDQYRAVQLRTWDTVCCLPAWLTVGWSHKQLLVLFVASAEKTIWRDALVYLSTRRNGPARAQRHPKAERELSRRLSFWKKTFLFLFHGWFVFDLAPFFASHRARQRLHFLPFHEPNGREGKRNKEEKDLNYYTPFQ